MNIWKQFFTSVIRWLLSIVAGWLIGKGIISESDASVWIPEMAAGIVVALIPLLWGLWQKVESRLALLIAQRLPATASLTAVKLAVEEKKADMTVTEQVKEVLKKE